MHEVPESATFSSFDLIPLLCPAFASIFFQSLMLLPRQWVHSSLLAFSLSLFKFGSLPVCKIPFSVRLGFLILLKSLACEYLSHFCSDSPLCNTGCTKIDSNSCLLFCTGFVFVEPYIEYGLYGKGAHHWPLGSSQSLMSFWHFKWNQKSQFSCEISWFLNISPNSNS